MEFINVPTDYGKHNHDRLGKDAVTYHWVTITGITIDKISNEVKATIASWGYTYEINLKGFIEDAKNFDSYIKIQ